MDGDYQIFRSNGVEAPFVVASLKLRREQR
jgi:hypothetical protein